MSTATAAFAFDDLAEDYDRQFTRSRIGSLMRAAVWQRLDTLFPPGTFVLELNCGTGEDAVYLGQRGIRVLATDRSAKMVELAQRKVAAAGLETLVEVRPLALEELDRFTAGPFGGALSNFGGLNCLADRQTVARGLANRLVPGAVVMLCVMGPWAPWEWLWYLARAEPAKAFRRFRPGGVPWRGVTIHYPSIGRLRREFAPWFRVRRVGALGALLPPPYAESWAGKHPRWLERLNRWERRWETLPPLPWLADHYLLELERT